MNYATINLTSSNQSIFVLFYYFNFFSGWGTFIDYIVTFKNKKFINFVKNGNKIFVQIFVTPILNALGI